MDIPFFQKKNRTGEVYCGILLKESRGVCYLFTKTDTEVALTAEQPFTYSDGWERIIEDVDEALAILEQGKEAHQRATHCIFFLFSHLIDPVTKEVAKPFIGKMRELVKSLEFKPVGYIEVIDAVHEHLEQKKQSQLSSIIVEIDDHSVATFLYKGGHKIFSQCVERTDAFARDVEKALHLKQEQHVFPTQMYLYNSDDLHKESSELLMHNWSRDAFIHPPRTTIIQPNELTVALIQLLNKQLCSSKEQSNSEDKDEEQKKEVMGFVVGADITQNVDLNQNSVLPKATFMLPQIRLPQLPRIPIVPILVTILLLGSVSGGVLYYLHKATILLRIPTETAKDTVIVTASGKPSEGEVLLSNTTSPFTVSDKKETTGKKDVGERASGEVSIYSYEENEIIIPKGKKMSVGSLEFESDQETAVPPAQFAGDGITKNPGKSKVKVRASILGTESNLEKGKRFTIEGYSSNTVFALNDAALTGGTKKTVRTIAKADIDSIKESVTERVTKDELARNKNNAQFLIVPDLTKTTIKKEQFSGEIGEEASTVTYTITGDVTIFRIPQTSIRDAVQDKLEKEKKEGFVTDSVHFEITRQKEDVTKSSISLTVQGEAVFSKKFETASLKDTLKGRNVTIVEQILRDEYGLPIERTMISPSIPFLKEMLPFFTHNIQVEIVK